MEVAAVVEIVKTLGLSGVFLFGCIYLYRAQEAKEKRIASDAKSREERLGKRLDATEEYIRTTQADALNRNTTALHEVSNAIEGLQRAVLNGQYKEGARDEKRAT